MLSKRQLVAGLVFRQNLVIGFPERKNIVILDRKLG